MNKSEKPLSHIFICSAIFYLVGCWNDPSPGNYKTAYIRKTGQSFTLMIKGRRSLHPASPFDIGKTYEDSGLYVIPRDTGIIKWEEIPFEKGHYPYSSGGITINGSEVKIELYFNDTDQKKIKTVLWNGDYDLVRIK